ncbi:hypothetical protein [uncultured Desulfuromusa sp.]|uniref:hypothetical protein n=1 Tax=uncultured Desulfuromusa sp. TaxID=219183 RepID=UPI002AA7CD21|nr:hypothetical protein [uncultured Desulfuromusa sp.]
MGRKEDDERAYTTYDDIVGRSIRRGTRKAASALTLGLIKGSDPLSELGQDAAKELATKVIPRSSKK